MGTNKKHILKLHVKSIYQLMNSFDAEGSEHNTNMETQTTIRQFLKSHLKAKKITFLDKRLQHTSNQTTD